MLRLFRSKFYLAVLLMSAVLLSGVLGYHYISGLTWLESLYMTIITVTTVGFQEVQPLSDTARLFTIFLIIASVFIFAFAISVITEYLLSKNSIGNFKKKKLKERIDHLQKHVIVCGYGRNGSQAAERLQVYNRPFVIVEKHRETIEKFAPDFLFIEGDANEDSVLEEAGIRRASYLIVALPDDAMNLFVVLTARQLNPNLFIISRASQISSVRKLQLAGADKVIMPDKIGGDHMASLVVIPDLITFMDKLSIQGAGTTNLEEVSIEDFRDHIECNTLRDLDLRRKTGCTIIGYIKPDGTYIINPEADLPLEPRSKVIVLGRPEQILKLNEMFHIGQAT